MSKKSVAKIILLRLIGFVAFLILLGIANIISGVIQLQIFTSIVELFNSNILLLFVITVIFLIGEIFWAFRFPFNLPAPIVSSVGAVVCLIFFFRLFSYFKTFFEFDIPESVMTWSLVIYPLLFFIVLIAGYVSIVVKLAKPEKVEERVEAAFDKSEKIDEVGEEIKKAVDGFGEEFKEAVERFVEELVKAIEEIVRDIRKAFNKNNK